MPSKFSVMVLKNFLITLSTVVEAIVKNWGLQKNVRIYIESYGHRYLGINTNGRHLSISHIFNGQGLDAGKGLL